MKYIFLLIIFACCLPLSNAQVKVLTESRIDVGTQDQIFYYVDEEPRFIGCENIDGSFTEKEICSDRKLLEYIYQNLDYLEAEDNNYAIMDVPVHFTVWKDGTVRNIYVSSSKGIQFETIKVFETMNKTKPMWRPAYKNGKPVNTRYRTSFKMHYDGGPGRPPKNMTKNTYIVEVADLDKQPIFTDCPRRKNLNCTIEKLKSFIKENQIYPRKALIHKVEGTVNITFVIEKDGSLTDINAWGDARRDLREDAIEIFKLMNHEEMKWTPGKIGNRMVRTFYRYDVVYDLAEWAERN